jgi:hypothetical protein
MADYSRAGEVTSSIFSLISFCGVMDSCGEIIVSLLRSVIQEQEQPQYPVAEEVISSHKTQHIQHTHCRFYSCYLLDTSILSTSQLLAYFPYSEKNKSRII